MRLAQGIIIDKEKTFGRLKFSALRREVFLTMKMAVYQLKSKNEPMI